MRSIVGVIASASIALLLLLLSPEGAKGQIAMGQSDRSQQELALLGWTAAVRSAYCQHAQIQELIDPFKEAISRMLNRHCRTPSSCRLKKNVNFSKHQVVLLDGYPRREHRTLHFRFFVVLPHDAVPEGKKPEKPLLSSQILSEMLDSQIGELSHGLGWQVLGHERYPRFDPSTTFFNRWLIPIIILAGLCMFFLAYWTTAFTSGSSLYAGGWLVRGSSGGKNAALRRTMEIIEEQKYRFALYDAQRGVPPHSGQQPPRAVVVYKSNERVRGVQGPPKSLATSYSTPQAVEANRAMPIVPAPGDRNVAWQQQPQPSQAVAGVAQQPQKVAMPAGKGRRGAVLGAPQQQMTRERDRGDTVPMTEMGAQLRQQQYGAPGPSAMGRSLSTASGGSSAGRREADEAGDVVPEIVVMHAQNSSQESKETSASELERRRMSAVAQAAPEKGHRRLSRRVSIGGGDGGGMRKKSLFGSGARPAQTERPKRWKASSLVLSKLGSMGGRRFNK